LLAALMAAVCHAQQSSSSSSGAATLSPAKSASSPADRVVLKVGNMQMTQADFETMVSDLEAQQGPADLSRKAIGDNFAQLFMLSQQAVANHLDSSPEVVRQLALDRNQILSNAEFARLKNEAKPTEQEISAYYSAHSADYDTVDLRRVFIWSSSDGSKDGHGFSPQQAKALAGAVRHAYASGGDVAKVIRDTPHGSEDVVFDTDPLTFQRGELPTKLAEAAFALKQGEWTELNDAPGTYVFLNVVKRSRRDLKEVSPQIEKKLQAQKLREELDSLKKNAGIWMDEEYFAPAPKKAGSSAQSKASTPTKAGEEKDEDKRQK
jgi:parvulin-like peptidyl-prolyl isomerase